MELVYPREIIAHVFHYNEDIWYEAWCFIESGYYRIKVWDLDQFNNNAL